MYKSELIGFESTVLHMYVCTYRRCGAILSISIKHKGRGVMNLRCKFHLTANLSICALFFLTLSMSSLSLAAHVSDRHRMVLHVW